MQSKTLQSAYLFQPASHTDLLLGKILAYFFKESSISCSKLLKIQSTWATLVYYSMHPGQQINKLWFKASWTCLSLYWMQFSEFKNTLVHRHQFWICSTNTCTNILFHEKYYCKGQFHFDLIRNTGFFYRPEKPKISPIHFEINQINCRWHSTGPLIQNTS